MSPPNRASAATCARWASPNWATATCCPRPPVAEERFLDPQAIRQRPLTAGTNLTVLKTTVGSAQSVAVAIDTARWPEVVGTISGDDTIFIATAGRASSASSAIAFSPFRTLNPMTSTSRQGAEPILLAFSGGLDTSFCVPWLKDTYQRPVITVTVDTGGIDAAAAQSLAERSAQLGAIEHHLIDARAPISSRC
jgi:hypothetical protein